MSHGDFVNELMGRIPTYEVGRLILFPYPNTITKLRTLSVLGADDLVVMRAAAGRIAATTDRLLPGCVHSARLSKRPPAWSFCKPAKSHKRFRKKALALIEGGHEAMCRTDVENYYGSIDLTVAAHWLREWGCNQESTDFLLRLIEQWQLWANLRGIPVGPEGSAVVGNALLLPLDQRMSSLRAQHLRWMDDILIFATTPVETRLLVNPADEEIGKLRLKRSIEKTAFFDTGQESKAAIEDDLLASGFAWFDIDEKIAVERFYDVFDLLASDPSDADPKRFRAALKTLMHRKDPYAAGRVAADEVLANTDPKTTGEYLAEVALADAGVADDIYAKLEKDPHDRFDALDLHLLKAVTRKSWGEAEGRLLLRVGMDRVRRSPVRCWAWRAASRTPAWNQDEAAEAAEAEQDPMVRRSIVATLVRAPDCQSRATFLRHVCDRFPSLLHTGRWVERTRNLH